MPRCLECREKFVPIVFLGKFCENTDCQIAKKKWQSDKKSGTVKKTPKAIPKVSEKRKIDDLKYYAQRVVFLGKPENKICPITGNQTTDVHHKKGRVGSLYLDETYWIALSREGHKFVEENPEWAKNNDYSLHRL